MSKAGGGYASAGAFLTQLPGGAPAAAVSAGVGGLIAGGAAMLGICRNASYTKKAVYLNVAYTGTGCWGQ